MNKHIYNKNIYAVMNVKVTKGGELRIDSSKRFKVNNEGKNILVERLKR